MKRLSFGRIDNRCYFWLRKTDKPAKHSTLNWYLSQVNAENIISAIESFSDWFPKRRNQRIWIVYAGRAKDNPAMRLAYIRRSTPDPTFIGPRNNLLTFDEAYPLWCMHIRFLATDQPIES